MPTSEQVQRLMEVAVLLSDDRGTPEDISKAREIMDTWPADMDDIAADIEEAISVIELERR